MFIVISLQSNTIPERATIYDFCFEKKASGQWIDWMETVDKHLSTLAPDAKVSEHSLYLFSRSCLQMTGLEVLKLFHAQLN